MFCPICKSEYRPGFTQCSDCGVPLVESLDDASLHGTEPANANSSVTLRVDTNFAVLASIGRALDDAKIEHRETFHDVGVLVHKSTRIHAILVHSRDEQAARRVLEEWEQRKDPLGDENEESEAVEAASTDENQDAEVEESDESEEPLEPAPGFVPEDFNPEEATAEVWSGNSRWMVWGLGLSLKENGIGCKITSENGTTHFRVLPSDEARAREIVREILAAQSDP